MVIFNFYFLDNDKIDFYGVVGVGYGNWNFIFVFDDLNDINSLVIVSLIFVVFKIGVGFCYFFMENIGVNVVFQVGQGGIINGGIFFKF